MSGWGGRVADEGGEPAASVSAGDVAGLLLGAPERYTRGEVASASGVDPSIVRRYWRALGFASAADDAVAFTDADIDALASAQQMVDDLELTEEEMVRLIRAIGRTTARLAEWVTEEYLHWALARGLDPAHGLSPPSPATVPVRGPSAPGLPDVLPQLDAMVHYAFRRQLSAAVARALDVARDEQSGACAVGFGDLVSFTAVSRRMLPDELAVLVERFETAASDVVAAGAGRLVKTLGDEVMFTTEEPAQAADIALALVARLAREPDMPQIRVGLAYGDVITRMGDVFGTTVNLASRLTNVAPRGGVLVDGALADALRLHGGYRLGTLRRRAVRGFGIVDAVRVRPPH